MKFVHNEIRILKMVNHPHIIHLEIVYESYRKIYLILELCVAELGAVFKQRKQFPENDAKKVVGELVSAVAYLHKHGKDLF